MGDNLPALARAGVLCGACGGSTFITCGELGFAGMRQIRVDCAACRRFVCYVSPAGGPPHGYRPAPPVSCEQRAAPLPAEEWSWIGLIRQDDGVWRPVGMAKTLAKAWDILMHYPGDGDLLCVPTRPVVPASVLDAEKAAADLARGKRYGR
jgi:hypothetical protein